MGLEPSVGCGVCDQEIRLGDRFCPGCGREATAEDRALLQARLEGSDFEAHDRGNKVRAAGIWIGVLAVLFAVSGVILFVIQKMHADDALANLRRFQGAEVLEPINGQTYTAAELRAALEREPWQTLITNGILSVVMAALWWWAKRAPLAAITCAFALFIVVQLVTGLIDPTTLAKGFIIKAAAVAVLGAGLKAALAARADMRRRGA